MKEARTGRSLGNCLWSAEPTTAFEEDLALPFIATLVSVYFTQRMGKSIKFGFLHFLVFSNLKILFLVFP